MATINTLNWLYEKGREEQHRDSYDKARIRFRQILDRTRESDWVERANAGLAEVYLSEGNLFWAMDHIRRAIKRNPRSGHHHFVKGKIHFEREEWRSAADEAIKAVESDDRSGTYYHLLARALHETGDHQQAERYFHWALEFSPDNLEIRFDYVTLQIERGNFQSALQLLKAGLKSNADSEQLREKIRVIQENWKITGT